MKRLNVGISGEKANNLRKFLKSRIVHQDAAIETIVEAVELFQAGATRPDRPIKSFLQLGPTGVGKTALVQSFAEYYFQNPGAVIKIDCGEFQHSHEIAKLIGSPPGYLGHRETHPLLSQQMLNRHHNNQHAFSIVLFDEIEKASNALWNLLLGILDKATLTLGDNNKVDFSRTFIFMTSNLGYSTQDRLQNFTFLPTGDALRKQNRQKKERGAIKRTFTPEFLNRLDYITHFQPLSAEAIQEILEIELHNLWNRIKSQSAMAALHITDAAKHELIKRGVSEEYGARFLQRVVDKNVVHAVVRLLNSGQVTIGDLIQVDAEDGEFVYNTSENAKEFNQILASASLKAAASASTQAASSRRGRAA